MKFIVSVFDPKTPIFKSVLIMKMVVFLLLASCFQVHAAGQKMSLSKTNAPLKEVFQSIEKQSGYLFMYESGIISPDMRTTVKVRNADIDRVMDICLKDLPLSYTIVGKSVLLKKKPVQKARTFVEPAVDQEVLNRTLTGTVLDDNGNPMDGASVFVKGNTKIGTTTNTEGKFTIYIPADAKVLIVNFVGYKSVEIPITAKSDYTVRLQPEVSQMGDIVITGIYTRQKDHFTGSSSTFKGEQLKEMGNLNVIQSLKTLDPSILVVDNKSWGSDPNRLPDIEVRGKSSIVGLKEQYGVDPNQPLFILDGFETSLQTIMDLSIDRIESVTILKDAASTAIYGSKAANGVIVVETKSPQRGKLRVNYSGNFNLQFPDLSDYNLMNSQEKLEFERLAGFYSDANPESEFYKFETYNKHLAEIQRGVNTYWLSEPLRTVLNSRHNLYAEGGDKSMRYGLGINYGQTKGVMKGSDKELVSANIDLIYRISKLRFSNKAVFDYSDANREPVAFSQYAKANPYYRKKNEDGQYTKILDNIAGTAVANPAYIAQLNYLNNKKDLRLNDNFQVEWDVASGLRLRGRIGLTYAMGYEDLYKSPRHPDFENTIETERGRYDKNSMKSFSYNGDVAVTYGKLFAEKHQMNMVGGWSFNESNNENGGYSVIGFINDNFKNPSFAAGYPQGSKPRYSKMQSKATSFFLNGNYSYDSRFLMDLNLRSDGSSVFGVNNPFTNTWSAGLAWNLHNEKMLEDATWINLLKIRGSMGNPGNQNFDAYQAMKTYTYNSWLQNMFGISAVISSFGNKDLKWQKTLNQNVGVDMVMIDNRLRLTFDYYYKDTDPLLAFIAAPTSLGTNTIITNLGRQITRGFDGNVSFSPIYRIKERINWTVSVNFRHDKSEYREMGNALQKLNEANKNSKSLQRYYDYGSADDLWAVPSLGIDPATGKELFLKKDGTSSFKWDADDEVVVGNGRPDLEGVIGSSLYYKGFSFTANFRYRLGGETFASALYNKVENISADNIYFNQDKRAFYDRWKQPGDVSKFKGISVTEATPMSSRFILSDDTFAAESISVGYESRADALKVLGISSLTIRAYMNDIFRISSLKEERGIEYPFARTISLSLNARF